MNIVEPDIPFDQRTLRAEWIKLLSRPQYTHAITLALNAEARPIEFVREKFGHFALEVDRLVLRCHRVDRKSLKDRFEAIAVPEKLRTNAHLHVAANLSAEFLGRPFDTLVEVDLERRWKRVTRGGGTLEIRPIADAGWAQYVVKALDPRDPTFFHAHDFHSHTNVIQFAMTDGVWPFEWSIAA